MQTDYVQRFLFEELDIRGRLVCLTGAWGKMLEGRAYPAQIADLLGCATPEELLAQPLGTIFAQWESTHEDGSPMVAEDVPSYKIVNGQPAEPLLTRIVNRETGEQRWRLVKAAPLRTSSGETMAVSVIEDVTEAKEAELRQRFLAQAGEVLSSSLDFEQTLQRVAEDYFGGSLSQASLRLFALVREREPEALETLSRHFEGPWASALPAASAFGARAYG